MAVANRNGFLRTLDLFSGIGGMSNALEDTCIPVAYCDISKDSQFVLKRLMEENKIPKAPICNDICELSQNWLKNNLDNQNIDLIVSGSPCIGFSPLGLRKGFDDHRSKLFNEVLRIIDITHCPLILFENVPNIIKFGMKHILYELCIKRQYEVRWCIVNAKHVGAYHSRARWFCLAIKKNKIMKLTLNTKNEYKEYNWNLSQEQEPQRLKLDKEYFDANRLRLLGNAVVPDAVRYAFIYLLSGCIEKPHSLQMKDATIKGYNKEPTEITNFFDDDYKIPMNGQANKDGLTKREPPGFYKQPLPLNLTFDPHFLTNKAKSPLLKKDILKEKKMMKSWSTPRVSCTGPANYLTERTIKDLPSQLRFEVNTTNKEGRVNPNYVEYLMGFPLNWTKL